MSLALQSKLSSKEERHHWEGCGSNVQTWSLRYRVILDKTASFRVPLTGVAYPMPKPFNFKCLSFTYSYVCADTYPPSELPDMVKGGR